MEHKKILNLLSEASDSKFLTRKWNTGNVNSKANCDTANKIVYNTEVLKSNLCDYNDAYILVRVILMSQQLLQHNYHWKIVHHLLNVSQKLMEQQ